MHTLLLQHMKFLWLSALADGDQPPQCQPQLDSIAAHLAAKYMGNYTATCAQLKLCGYGSPHD
jgi:hypothetical protein